MIEVIRPGEIPYAHGLAMQLMLRARLYKREEDDPLKGYFLVLEHPRTVTLGRRGELEHLMSPALLAPVTRLPPNVLILSAPSAR